MTKNIKIKISLVVLALATHYALLTTHCAYAQQVNLALDPPIVTAKIKPGKSIIIAYTVQNNGDPTNLQFLIRPFLPQGQFGSLSLLPQLEGPIQFNLENTDLLFEKPFFFPSKEKKQAVLRIYVPPGIPDGDYYYLLLAETVPAFSVAGQSTGIASASIGSPLLITITESGISEVKATIGEFSIKPDYILTIGNNVVRVIDSARELPIVLSVRNMGKNLIQPQGAITDQQGTKKKVYQIIPQNILSNSQRVIKVFSDETTLPIDTSLILSHITIGNHVVRAEVTFGEGTPIQYKMIPFLALPIRLIKITIVALIMVGVLFLVRFYKKRHPSISR